MCTNQDQVDRDESSLDKRIREALGSYRCQNTSDEDNRPSHLADVLTPEEYGDIGQGLDELDLLAEHIADVISGPSSQENSPIDWGPEMLLTDTAGDEQPVEETLAKYESITNKKPTTT